MADVYSTLQETMLTQAEHTLTHIADLTPDGESEADLEHGAALLINGMVELSHKWLMMGIAIGLQQPAIARRLWRAQATASPDFTQATENLVSKLRTTGDA